jgi:DNA-binding CsgD family transcriptional regulator
MDSIGGKDKPEYSKKQKSDEFFKIYFHQSDEGIWLAKLDKPLPVDLPIEQQEVHMLKHAYLAECNLTFVKMYGYDDPENIIGARFPQLLDNAEASNLINLRTFLKDGYQTEHMETAEIGKNGKRKYFLNDAVGIIEDNHLVRIWGRQQDITTEKSKREVLNQLTPEQLKVLKTTVEGKTMKEIASEVGISHKSVESIRNQIKTIIGVDTIAQLIATAIQLGINEINV